MASTFGGTNISYGATGDVVKQIQKALNKTGNYNLTVDGIWGKNTDAAVRAYQKANGLTVDGIVGNNTWASLFGDGASSSTDDSGYEYTKYEYDDYTKSDAVLSADQKKTDAENAVANYGDFSYANQSDLDSIIKRILNREDFSYDFNSDALYQQYKDKYIKQGKMAMQDTIGQAAAMTGGYGNSYAVTAGNQAYQASLENLNDIIPELYQMAYDKYNQEGQDMYNQYSLLSDDKNTQYGRWSDGYNRLVADRDYYSGEAKTLNEQEYNQWFDKVSIGQTEHTNEENAKYQTYRDSVEDEQWQKTYDLSERELEMEEEAWELEKNGYGSSGSSGGSDDSGDGEDGDTINPTKTDATSRFIALHQTKDEYMRRGKSYTQFKEYIEAEIEKAEGSLSDEELMYLIQYYGLS